MDPLTALSLAVNIIALLDVAHKLVATGYEVSRSSDGYTKDNREADGLATDIEFLAASLKTAEDDWLAKHADTQLEANERALREISSGCKEIAKELINRLRKLQPHGRFTSIAIIRTSFKLVWEKEDIERCRARVEAYRDAMNTRMLVGLREHLKGIDRNQDVRFTALDEGSRRIADAIVEQQDIFSEQLDLQTDMLEDIMKGQRMLTSILLADRSVSPAPLSLHEAARTGEIKTLRKLLVSSTVDADAVDQQGRTALHYSANADVVEKLVARTADINAEDDDGMTPLHTAVKEKRLDVVKVLLSKRADKTRKDDSRRRAEDYAADSPAAMFMLRYGWETESKATERLDATGLMYMAWLGDVDGVRFYLSQNAEVNARNRWHETGLTEASRHGDLEVVKLLLDNKADIEAKTGKDELTPLLLAVKNRRITVVEELLAHGAKTEARSKTKHMTAILEAASNRKWSVFDLLVNHGARLAVRDENGWTPLHWTVHHATLSSVNFLLAKQVPVNVKSNAGETPLFLACKTKDRPDVVEALLKAGAVPALADNEGNLPLVWCCKQNYVENARLLLQYGADPTQAADASRAGIWTWSPLTEAAHCGHAEMVRMLLDKGASVDSKTAGLATVLHHAVRESHSNPDVVQMLLDKGANVRARNSLGATPLHLACRFSNVEVVRVLLDGGAESEATAVDRKDPDRDGGLTPLMFCCMRGSGTYEMVELLVQRRPESLNVRSSKLGRTALFMAVCESTKRPLSLLNAGADVNIADSVGDTPLIRAAYQGNRPVVKRLVELGADRSQRNWKGVTAAIAARHAAKDDDVGDLLEI